MERQVEPQLPIQAESQEHQAMQCQGGLVPLAYWLILSQLPIQAESLERLLLLQRQPQRQAVAERQP
jgi:hypothetical protein